MNESDSQCTVKCASSIFLLRVSVLSKTNRRQICIDFRTYLVIRFFVLIRTRKILITYVYVKFRKYIQIIFLVEIYWSLFLVCFCFHWPRFYKFILKLNYCWKAQQNREKPRKHIESNTSPSTLWYCERKNVVEIVR